MGRIRAMLFTTPGALQTGSPIPKRPAAIPQKSRGLEQRPRGRKPKYNAVTPQQPGRETLKDSKGNVYLLS